MFTPYYVFVNKTFFAIESQESDMPDTNWVKIEPGCCEPFWPRSKGKVKSIHLRPFNTSAVTPDFNYDSTDSCLLRLNNQVSKFFQENFCCKLKKIFFFSMEEYLSTFKLLIPEHSLPFSPMKQDKLQL